MDENKNIFEEPARYNLSHVQIVNWDVSLWEKIDPLRLREEAERRKITVNSIWVGYSGKVTWNFIEGPSTIGLVPRETREKRIMELLDGAHFASRFGAKAIVTHLGFLPENCRNPLYIETVDTVGEIARELEKMGLDFWFETGQETPVTLLRLIEDVGMSNTGINLDPANLVMYGKANPVDSLDVFGRHVRSLHIKDGLYPTTGKALGQEVPPGKGKVDFSGLLSRLCKLGFSGDLIIERELSGGDKDSEILSTISLLNSLIRNNPE